MGLWELGGVDEVEVGNSVTSAVGRENNSEKNHRLGVEREKRDKILKKKKIV